MSFQCYDVAGSSNCSPWTGHQPHQLQYLDDEMLITITLPSNTDNQDNKGEFTWTPKSDDLKKLNKGKNTLYIYSGHDENSNWGTAYYN